AFAQRVQHLIATEYGADRSRPVRPLPSPLQLTTWLLRTGTALAPQLRRWRPPWPGRAFADLDVNYRILAALDEKVRSDGGVLVFADAFQYLERYGMPRGSDRLVARN